MWLGLQFQPSAGLTWVDGQRVIGYPASSRLFVWESRRLLSQEVEIDQFGAIMDEILSLG